MLILSLALAAQVDEPVHTKQSAPNDYAVVIGVEDYAFLPDVPHAAADASAVRTWLMSARGIPSDRIETLTDASKEQIEAALARGSAQVGSGGTYWVYWAGHGAASPSDGSRLLLGVDTMADASVFEARALSVDALEVTLGKAPNAFLWLDTCYAGASRDGTSLLPGTRFAVPTFATATPGKVVRWTAAQAGELSQAHPSGHGAFTWASLTALQGAADGELDGTKDHAVTAAEAQAYVVRILASAGIRNQTPGLVGPDDLVLVHHLPALIAPAAPAPRPAPVLPRPAPVASHPPAVPPTSKPTGRRSVAIGLGVGAGVALATAVATRAAYVNAPVERGPLEGLVTVNQVSAWSGLALGAGALGVSLSTRLAAK